MLYFDKTIVISSYAKIMFYIELYIPCSYVYTENNRIYNGVEAETRKSRASFQIIQVPFEALPRMTHEKSENEPEISLLMSQHHH